MTRNTYFIPLLLLMAVSVHSQDYQVRIAFMGNSITQGTGLSHPGTACYPAQFAELINTRYADTCLVKNFAVSGRTMLKKGDYPLWNENKFDEAWMFAPDIVFILLGTNDTKPQNWDAYGNEFMDDYIAMMDTFKVRNPEVQFMVCYPPPAFDIVWGIRNSVIVDEIIPIVDTIVEKTGAFLLDFYTPLLDSNYLFPDNIHPNIEGAKVMANMVYNAFDTTDIVHNATPGLPFITSITSNKAIVSEVDHATITWTNTNADTVFFDGRATTSNSVNVAGDTSTTYQLVAKNTLGADTLYFTQFFYQQEIAGLTLRPRNPKITTGDTIVLSLYVIDQYSEQIYAKNKHTHWEISSGEGALFNLTDSTAGFVTTTIGRTKVTASIGDFSAFITISSDASSVQTNEVSNVKIYPVPFNDDLKIEFEENRHVSRVLIYNQLGALMLKKEIQNTHFKNTSININTSILPKGSYILTIQSQQENYSFSLIK